MEKGSYYVGFENAGEVYTLGPRKHPTCFDPEGARYTMQKLNKGGANWGVYKLNNGELVRIDTEKSSFILQSR